MEIEIVIRMEASTDDFEDAEAAIKEYFKDKSMIRGFIPNKTYSIKFRDFHFMAAQPIED